MKMCFALLITALTAWSGVFGEFTCSQQESSTRVSTFKDAWVRIQMPCKYNAVRQKCGNYDVVLSPGIITMGNQYRLNTMWLGLKLQNGTEWEGRTTNKMSVKFYNGNSTELFRKKNTGGLNTEGVLTFRVEGKTTVAETTDGSMKVTFAPWDPDMRDKGFQKSYWSFTCNKDDAIEPYPKQVCGAEGDDGFKGMKKDDGKDDGLTSEQMFLYNVFMETDTDISQVDEQCLAVEKSMQVSCKEDSMRKEAMVTCSEIIVPRVTKKGQSQQSNCINKYSCSPMHVFVDCVAWVCSNYKDEEACSRIGESTDMCKELKEGNLTKKVENAKCYKDFLPIYPRT